MSSITQIQNNKHILGIYSSPQRKIEEGLEFLRTGFEEKDEAILMITDELSKDDIRNEIIIKWKKIYSENELADLEINGIINIKSSREFYFSSNIIDRAQIFKHYCDLANKAIEEKGKRGLRIFVDLRIFFERGYNKYVIEFEKSLPPLFDFPLTFLCGYDIDDYQNLDQESKKILFDHHNLYLKDNLFQNIFDNSFPPIGSIKHICMYFDKESQSFSSSSCLSIATSLIRYLDEGLQKDQLCVYLSMCNMKKDHSKNIMSKIPYTKDSSIEKNLMIVLNPDDYYISAVMDNLKPFDDLKRQIFMKATLDNKKEIRIVSDIPDFLFKNKHFDQCVLVEEWWDQTIEELNKTYGLNVSLLCFYNNSNFHDPPFNYHKYRINDNHSIVCDSEGLVHSKFDSPSEKRRKSEKGE